jgi:hypothetical protein
MKLLKRSQLTLVMALGLSTVFSGSTFAAQLSEDGAEAEPKVVNTAQLKPLPHLPLEIWLHIIKFIPIKQRLYLAARVCKLWKKHAYEMAHELNFTSNQQAQEIIPADEIIKVVQIYPAIKSLNFSGCEQIFNAELATITKSCPMLQSLNLDWCYQITDTGFQEIAINCPLLLSLILSWCGQITDTGLEVIAKNCKLLQSLDLFYCKKITNTGLQAIIENCKLLKTLTLLKCDQITAEAITQLKHTHQNLEIIG